nr:putative HNHc nuclease [Lactiplantibacillus plantarum]
MPTKLIEKDGEWYQVQKLTHKPNLDHIETVSGSTDEYYTYSELADTRKVRPQQRRLFFALLNDIVKWYGAPIKDFLKELFYTQFEVINDGKSISLSDSTQSSVSDANDLLDLVIDFMFEWHIEFKEGYKMLTKDERFYLYQCCRHRICTVCGKHADIHHVVGSTIGAGGDRTKVDHTKRHVMALCRVHHSEIEQIGSVAFSAKYHVPVDGIKLDKETLKRIGLKGKYSSD